MKAADTEAAFRGDSAKAELGQRRGVEGGGRSDKKSERFAANLTFAWKKM